MMCEHEFVQEEWIVEVCKKCGKLLGKIDGIGAMQLKSEFVKKA